MSRIGKKPVTIPAGVDVKLADDVISVKGPKGQLEEKIDKLVTVKIEGNEVIVEPIKADDKDSQAAHGLTRTLIHNMVTGVTEGFEKKLTMLGVGYRAEKKGNTLVMQLGYSHPVEMPDPEGIKTEVTDPTNITVSGIDKAYVGNYAAVIRSKRPPEPYKGKGIRYVDEYVRRKEGKAGAKGKK